MYDDVASQIIDAVGGKDNVNNAWHCITRLRFDLKDKNKIDKEKLEAIQGVQGSLYQNGQFQVIIGTDVDDYYKPVAEQLGLDADAVATEDNPGEKKGFMSLVMDTVSGVFGPIVPAIAGAGMIKGLMAGLAAIGVISSTSDTYIVLDMLASGVFTFLPFFVAASAARVFKTNVYLAIALAAAMQYPTMTAAAAAGEISSYSLFGFIPVPVLSYAGNVIPILMTVFAMSYIWRGVDKILPKVMRTVFTPMITLFVTGILAFALLGPIGDWIGDLLGVAIAWMFSASPVIAGAVFGAIRPISVFFGIHHAMTPIALQNFETQGWDNLMPMMFMANMAMMGATFAMYFKVRKEQRGVVLSAAVSALLGITEPALFGVLSKYRKAFIAATIGSAVASVFFSVVGVKIYGYILSSIFSLVAYVGPYFPFAIIGILIAAGVSFGITWVLVPAEKDDEELLAEAKAEA